MTDDVEIIPPPLGETRGDVIARTLGTLAGTIPCIGPMVQIALNETIPNARLERIEAYLRHLSKRIEEMRLSAALKSPEGLDLFEEGIAQASRASSGVRLERIAALVAHGLKSDDIQQATARHFLRILSQLDDRQIILLNKLHSQNMPTFHDGLGIKYTSADNVTLPQATAEDITDMSGEQADANLRLNASMMGQLESLGLFESAGMLDDVGAPLIKRRFKLSLLGVAFLEYVGLVDREGKANLI